MVNFVVEAHKKCISLTPLFRYACDENSLPPMMVLQPISSKLPNFLNKLMPEAQEGDQRKWWQILSGLQENLRYVATYLFKVLIYPYVDKNTLLSQFFLTDG